jgi:hypothetical protein
MRRKFKNFEQVCEIRGYLEKISYKNISFPYVYNLSQEEIDALVEELYKENEEKGQLEFFGIPHIKDIPCTSPVYNTTIKLNMDCDHDWKIYQGLNQTDTYCTKCNEIKK